MARALVAHESAWVEAWSASAEATLAAGLAVPLVVWSRGAAAAAGGGGRARSSSSSSGSSRSSSRSSSSSGDAVSTAPSSSSSSSRVVQKGQASAHAAAEAAAAAGNAAAVTKTLSPGLDRRVLAAAADARWMLRLGCDVPARAAAAASSERELRLLSASLSSSIETASSLLNDEASPRSCALLAPHVAAFESWLAAKGAELTWTSPRSRAFAEEARCRAMFLVDLAERLWRLLESGVDEQLERAAAVDVLGLLGKRTGTTSASAPLPPPPLPPSEFAAATSKAAKVAKHEFECRSEAAAAGVEEIATMLAEAAAAAEAADPLGASSSSPSPSSGCSAFFSQQPATLAALKLHVEHRFRRAVASSVAASLAELRERVLSIGGVGCKEASSPLFAATLELGARGPELAPKPLELQRAVDDAVDAAVAAGASLAPWAAAAAAESSSSAATLTPAQQQQQQQQRQHSTSSSSFPPPPTIADVIAGDARVLGLALALSGAFSSEERAASSSSSSSSLSLHSAAASAALAPFARFEHLWTRDAATDVAVFAATSPDVDAFVPKLAEHAAMMRELDRLQQQQQGSSTSSSSSSSSTSVASLFSVDARPLVSALLLEASAWRDGYLRSLRALASADLSRVGRFVRLLGSRLGGGGGRGGGGASGGVAGRGGGNNSSNNAAAAASSAKADSLIDARNLADALDELSSKADEMAESATRVERAYELLEAHGGKQEEEIASCSSSVSDADASAADAQSEADAAATLSYELKKLHRAGAAASAALEARRPALEQDLSREAALLAADADALCAEWAAAAATLLRSSGSSASSPSSSPASTSADPDSSSSPPPSLTPFAIKARLDKFSESIAARTPRWEAAAAARAVFGLPPLRHEGLTRATAEVAGLSRLYALHCDAREVIDRYSSLPWVHNRSAGGGGGGDGDGGDSSSCSEIVDVFDATAEMAERIAGFQASALSLPKSLKEWPAYSACRAAVDRVAERVPLLALLSHRAMRARHWAEVRALLQQQQQGEELLPPMPFGDGDGETSSSSSSSPAPLTLVCVGHLLSADLPAHRLAIEDVAARALKEQAIELKLSALAATWSAARLSFADHKDRGAMVLKPSDTAELLESLEDALVTLGSLASNRHAIPFRERVVAPWQGKLSAVAETLERWLAVQSMWCYMEAVFSGGEIVRQLPGEARRFAAIDRGFVQAVSFAREAGGVLEACLGGGGGSGESGGIGNAGAAASSSSSSSSSSFSSSSSSSSTSTSSLSLLASTLPNLLEQLELCQKSLTAYLEGKRALFPRFYFVSDPTLLEILSQGSDPRAVAQHFQSGLFDYLASLAFDDAGGAAAALGGGRALPTAATATTSETSSSSSSLPAPLSNRIVAMVSAQGERVNLDRPVEAAGMAEAWLSRLVDGMKCTVRANLKAAVRAIAQAAAAAADGGTAMAAATASSSSSSSSSVPSAFSSSPPTPALTPADVVLSCPAQAALLALQYLWTAETQAALRAAAAGDRRAPARALARAEALLSSLVAATLRPGLTKNQRTSLETCITVHMHQKEATGKFLTLRVLMLIRSKPKKKKLKF